MNQLMTKEELNDFLEKEFPQVNKNFEILKVSNKKFSMLMHISSEHLRPGATVSGPTMFLLADVTFYLATLSVIGPKSLTVTTNCSINFLRKTLNSLQLNNFSFSFIKVILIFSYFFRSTIKYF